MSTKTKILTAVTVFGTLTTAGLGVCAGVLCCKKLNERIKQDPNWEAGNGETLKLCSKELTPVLIAATLTSLGILANEHEHSEIEAGLATALIAATDYISKQDRAVLLNSFTEPTQDIPAKKDDANTSKMPVALGRGYFSSYSLDLEVKSLGPLPPHYKPPHDVQKTGYGNFLFYDDATDQWFRSSPCAVLIGMYNLNRSLQLDEYPTLPVYCATFNIKCPEFSMDNISGYHKKSKDLGWSYDYISGESCLDGAIWLDFGRYVYDIPETGEQCMILSPELYPADLDYYQEY